MKSIERAPKIFISYRQMDSEHITGRIFDRLGNAFGKHAIFRDIDSIRPGENFHELIQDQLSTCRVVLIVIGPKWLDITDEEGERRLDKEGDVLVEEIKFSLNSDYGITCIPILIDGATLPKPEQLPEGIRDLTSRQLLQVRGGHDFDHDVDVLIDTVAAKSKCRLQKHSLALKSGVLLIPLIALIVAFWFYLNANSNGKVSPPLPGIIWKNTLGMKFAPVTGTDVLFSSWETRVKDFQTFARNNNYPMETPEFDGVYIQSSREPAVNVSWHDAVAFCEWLTRHERERGVLNTRQRYRLPTDFEWSMAIGLFEERGLTPKEKGENSGYESFPWGDQWPPPNHFGNYGGEESVTPDSPKAIAGFTDQNPFTANVGAYPAHPLFQIWDLSGNVWEWCEDTIDGSESGNRVLRGGSWNNVTKDRLSSAYRNSDPPTSKWPNVGFRCVLDFSP